jgi:ABC-type uncharacterized transport system permease subunit
MYSKPLTSNLNVDLLGSHPITTDFVYWIFFLVLIFFLIFELMLILKQKLKNKNYFFTFQNKKHFENQFISHFEYK